MSDPLPITIRPFAPADYERIADIGNRNFPDHPETAAELRDADAKRDAKFLFARFVAEDDAGAVIAFGDYHQDAFSFHPRKFCISLAVHPDAQRRGVGTRLYAHLLAVLEPFEPIRLHAYAQENKPAALAFLAKHGYREAMHEWESCLAPQTFNAAPFASVAGEIARQGIVIKTLRETDGDTDRDRCLYDLEAQVSLDIPSSEPATVPSFTDWHKCTFDSPGLLPDGYFVAVDAATGAYVGLSQLWARLSDNHLYTGATGVLPAYRRRGIALALKLRAVQYAKDTGVPVIRTWNAQINRAMLSINARIGFVKEPAWIEYCRDVRPEPVAIRQATPRDYAAIANVMNTVWHEFPETPEEMRHKDVRRSSLLRHDRFLIEAHGAPVAVGEYGQSLGAYDPHTFDVHIAVLPAQQGHGFGAALLDHILAALRPFAPHTLTTTTVANRVRAVRFLEERGFVCVQTEQQSTLDPATFDPARYADDLATVAAQGIVVRTFAEQKHVDPDLYTKYEALDWQIGQDIPHTETLTRTPFSEWIKRFDSPRFLPDGNFIAIDAATGAYVGETILWGSGANRDLHTGTTGVLAAHRKRGIATALKVRALTYAKERGATAVWTSNEINNAAMLGINAHFGFVRQPDELQYVKRLP